MPKEDCDDRLACDTGPGLDWVPLRTDRIEDIDHKPGCLKPVLIPTNAPNAYTLRHLHEAKEALAAIGQAGSPMRYWVLDADLMAPLLVSQARPEQPDSVAIVAPREDYTPAETRDACLLGSIETINLNATSVIGLGRWPVWYRQPCLVDDEEGV